MKLSGLAFTLVFLLPSTVAAQDEATAVKETFYGYKMAILQGDGEVAAALVTESTHDLYRQFADGALTLDKTGLDELHVMERLTILQLRHEMTRAQLESMSGGQIVAYAVDNGWIGKDSATRLQIGDFTIDGDTASAAILGNDGTATPLRMKFTREDGLWRLDLAEMMVLTRVVVVQAIRQTGMSEDEFILFALEAASGRKPGPEIWSPPL